MVRETWFERIWGGLKMGVSNEQISPKKDGALNFSSFEAFFAILGVLLDIGQIACCGDCCDNSDVVVMGNVLFSG